MTLDVPAGALDKRVAIRVSEVAGPPPGFTALSPQYRFEPEGLRFLKPATVTFQAAGDVAVGEIAWSTPAGTALAELDSTASASSLSASVDHFSSGCAVVSTRCGAAGQACCRGTGCKSGLSCSAGRCAGPSSDAGITDGSSGDAGPSSLKVACSAHFVGSGGAPLGIEVMAIASDPSGNIVVLGNFYGTADFGGGPLVSAGDRDLFVTKLDKDCKHLWSKRFGDAAEQAYVAMGTDSAGNIYLTGGERGTIDFGTGPLTSSGDYDIVVAKLTTTGDGIWAKRFGDAKRQAVTGLDVAPDGRILLTAQISGTTDLGGGEVVTVPPGAFGLLAGFDGAGALQFKAVASGDGPVWADGGGQPPQNTLHTPRRSGNAVFVGGQFIGTMSVGGPVLTTSPPVGNRRAGPVARVTSTGAHVWSKALPGSGTDVEPGWAGALAVRIRAEMPFDYGTGLVDGGYGFARVTESGDVVLARTLPEYPETPWDPTAGVAVTALLPMSDRLLVVGHAAGVVALDPPFTVGTKPIDSGLTEHKGFLALYDTAGVTRWAHTLGGTGWSGPHALSRYPAGGAIVGGQFKGAVQLGSSVYSTLPNQTDSFVLRLAPE